MENNNYTLQEKLRSFVAGELDESARRELLEQVRTEPESADELAFSSSLAAALRHSDMLEAKAVIGAVMAEEGFPPPSPPASKVKWWLITTVVTLALIGMLGIVYLRSTERSTSVSPMQELSRSMTQPLENVLFLPDSGEGLAALQAGMSAYDAGRYAEAARALNVYTDRRTDNAARVYLGVSLLLSEQAGAAVAPLADAALSPEPPVQEAALWYLALAYLEMDNPRAAKQALDRIPPGGLFGDQALQLKTKIN
jgi:hypothetical protein